MRKILAVMLAGVAACVFASTGPAQTGTGVLDITAQITSTGGRPEPVRQFTLCLLTKSYEEIKKEVEAMDPMPTKEEFINNLKVSSELKAWMTKHDVMDLTQIDFDKLVTPDDIMGVPEFLAAYQRSNSGGVTPGHATAKIQTGEQGHRPGQIREVARRVLYEPEEIHDGSSIDHQWNGTGIGGSESQTEMGQAAG